MLLGHGDKEYKAHEEHLQKYFSLIRAMLKHYGGFDFEFVTRSQNCEDHQLTKAGAKMQEMPPGIFPTITGPSLRI